MGEEIWGPPLTPPGRGRTWILAFVGIKGMAGTARPTDCAEMKESSENRETPSNSPWKGEDSDPGICRNERNGGHSPPYGLCRDEGKQ